MPGSSAELLWQVTEQGVARLTLNRPEAGNALTSPQREKIIRLLGEASGDHRVRVVIVTGAGRRHFCTGADLRGSAGPDTETPPQAPSAPPGRWPALSPAAPNG